MVFRPRQWTAILKDVLLYPSYVEDPAKLASFGWDSLLSTSSDQHRLIHRFQCLNISPHNRSLHLLLHSNNLHRHSKASESSSKIRSVQTGALGPSNQFILAGLHPVYIDFCAVSGHAPSYGDYDELCWTYDGGYYSYCIGRLGHVGEEAI